jgi:transcriptional regulator with XRE-family HTH domain
MVTQVKCQAVTDKTIIFEMRHAGAPMREIAEKMGVSKQRVSQILARNDGSTRHEWLSTSQLCAMTGLSRNRVLELHDKGIIVPAYTWDIAKRQFSLWAADSVKTIATYYDAHHLCIVCNRRLPKHRIVFCSDDCRRERHKYKNMTPEEKRRTLANIRRYREKKRQQEEAIVASAMSAPVLVL